MIDKKEIISRFRYDMRMLTFDPMTGEDCDPSRWGKDAEKLYQAFKSAIDYMENSEMVVRCKDCKYWRKTHGLCEHTKSAYGMIYAFRCDADFYCGYAERNEE